MKTLLRHVVHSAREIGVDPVRLWRSCQGLPQYLGNYREFRRQRLRGNGDFPVLSLRPCLSDRYDSAGTARGHYFHQDLLVAQRIHRRQPRRQVDVGSRIDGFVAHVASFREIEVFDVRPLTSHVRGITFRQADFTAEPFPFQDYCDSLSCLHAIEHFGLGRYGDPVNYEGHVVALRNLHRLLEVGGTLDLSTPISQRQRIEFDGHRVFAVPYLLDLLGDRFSVASFSYVNDAGELVVDADPNGPDGRNSFGCHYGCGIFELVKRAA